MFEPGQTVVCINDDFSATVRYLYKALPIKDHTYTVRSCDLGRGKVTSESGANETHFLVLLQELTNPLDPYCSDPLELGFRSDRFATPEQLEETEEYMETQPLERELVHVKP